MKGFSTKAIHVGEDPREHLYGDVVSPIHLSTTFGKRKIEDFDKGYVYSRTSNPTRNKLERKLAVLENAKYALAFSSGLAAESTIIFSLLKKRDHIVAFNDLYGGTKRLFDKVMKRFGIEVTYTDARDPINVYNSIKSNTKIVWIETPTNPLLRIADIREIARIAHEHGALLVVDNTFASPYFQKPLDLGADIVVHSVTKYISGHSDVVGGAVMVNDDKIYEKIKFHQNAIGAIMSPFDSWLVLRGVKTLAIRMERHQENALKIAEFLEAHEMVEKVYYPGLSSNPQYDLAVKQMTGFSGIVSFEIKGGLKNAIKLVESLEVIILAESFGGVESLIEIPSLMTHANIPREQRLKIGIKDNLIRLSVGIEDIQDLIEDLDRGFKRLK